VSRAGPSCSSCGALAASDQDFCLECGAPIETGQSPWPATLAVIGVVLVIALAAVAITYRGFVNDADRQASAPSPVSTEAAKVGRAAEARSRRSAATRRRERAPRSR
jgi:hypothetical protein